MTSVVGLRERKKLATRGALHAAALELAVRHGVAHVTAEDIAAAAGVSPRTFFNYFSTKEEAFVADDVDRGRRFVRRVAEAPDDAAVWPLLRQTAAEVFAAGDLPSRAQALKLHLVRNSPQVVAQSLATFSRLEAELVVELTRRCPDAAPLQPRLMANAVVAALHASVETWLSPEGDGSEFPALLDDAFATLGRAFASTPDLHA